MSIIATVSLVDSYGRPTTKRLETETDVIATAVTSVTSLLTDLENVTDLQAIGVSYSFKDPSQVFAGIALSNVDVGATFRLRLASGKIAAYKIPGFPDGQVDAGGVIDPAGIQVAAYFDNFLAAGDFTVSDGEAITDVLTGQLDK